MEDHVGDLQEYELSDDSPLVKQAEEVDVGRPKDLDCYKATDENDPPSRMRSASQSSGIILGHSAAFLVGGLARPGL